MISEELFNEFIFKTSRTVEKSSLSIFVCLFFGEGERRRTQHEDLLRRAKLKRQCDAVAFMFN